jgi:hypothetical protein
MNDAFGVQTGRPQGKGHQAKGRNQQARPRNSLRKQAQINPPEIRVEAGVTKAGCQVEQGEAAQKESESSRQNVLSQKLPSHNSAFSPSRH